MSTAFKYLDEISFRDLYCSPASPLSMKFYIEGIKCSKCVSKIESLKTSNPNLESIEVDMAYHTALVSLKTPKDSFSEIAIAINALGFQAIPVQAEDDPTQKWNLESRNDLIRLAVAAFCAGNIMMFAFAIYFGLQGDLKRIFEWTQFLFYLPVVVYVALPFYSGFLASLKSRSISIDGPMAIASVLGFVVSTWNLLRGEGSIYYDSTSGFLFLILATRYIQKMLKHEYLRYLRPQSLSETFKARLLEGCNWTWVPSTQLKKDQNVVVYKGEWIPVDGILASTQATLDLSVLNGESYARIVHKGFPVKAGSLLLSEEARVQVVNTGKQTLLGQILSDLKSPSIDETDSSNLSNRASQWLLVIVLGIASILLLAGIFINFEIYFERAFALIVLACPCAMAFGTPLAFSFSIKNVQKKGILVKSALAFESLKDVQNIFLDKTGTLTSAKWKLLNSNLEEGLLRYQQIILGLETHSQHPIAFALRDLWRDIPISLLYEVQKHQDLPNGVCGTIADDEWKFVSYTENGIKWHGLFCNSNLIWKFQLQPALRKGAIELIQYFKQQRMNVYLLSGDEGQETQRVALNLGIPSENVFADLTPQRKAEIVRSKNNSLMLGDGVNDTLALKNASVGIAVQGGVDLALKSADVLLIKEDLQIVPELFKYSNQTRIQIRRNLCVALVYNSIGGIAALMGFVDPFVAALLMPISSICILCFTWWGTRK